MGKEDKKDKKDKEKDKEKEKKEKKDKDKEKKEKKDKDKKKDKEKYKDMPDQEWKIPISKDLDNIVKVYEKIVNLFKDIDNYMLRDAKTLDEFIEKIQKNIEDLPEASQQIFINYINSLQS